MPDPLAGLAEKTAADPGAPFMPEALEALAALRQNNRAAFEALRSQLKKAGCRVTALDDAIAEENGTPSGRAPTQADILIDLAQTVALFHTPDGSGFADLDINGHRDGCWCDIDRHRERPGDVCTVRNMSPAGALLLVANAYGLPEQFDLNMHGHSRRCTARWRRLDRIGVKFESIPAA